MLSRSVFASDLSLFKPSLSKPAMALAAALALGVLPGATDAVAGHYPPGDGFRDDGFPDGGFRHVGYRPPPGYAMRRGPYAVRVYRDGHYRYYYYGCSSWRWAATPWGWRWRRVNICYPSSAY